MTDLVTDRPVYINLSRAEVSIREFRRSVRQRVLPALLVNAVLMLAFLVLGGILLPGGTKTVSAPERENGFAFSSVPVLRREYNSIPEGFDYDIDTDL